MILKQLSVLIENRKGSLAEITKFLKDENINIRAISAFDTPDYGILRLILDKPKTANDKLEKLGYKVIISDVIAIELEDKMGVLNYALSVLDEEDIVVEYIYSFVIRDSAKPLIILKVNNPDKAVKILMKNDIKVATKKEIHKD